MKRLSRMSALGAAAHGPGALAHAGQVGHLHVEALGGVAVSPAAALLAVLGLSALVTAAGVILGGRSPRARAR